MLLFHSCKRKEFAFIYCKDTGSTLKQLRREKQESLCSLPWLCHAGLQHRVLVHLRSVTSGIVLGNWKGLDRQIAAGYLLSRFVPLPNCDASVASLNLSVCQSISPTHLASKAAAARGGRQFAAGFVQQLYAHIVTSPCKTNASLLLP